MARTTGRRCQAQMRDPVEDNHGDWGLVPSSLGLVVLSAPQPASVSAKGAKLDAFIKLVCDNPPAYKTDWKYGGGHCQVNLL